MKFHVQSLLLASYAANGEARTQQALAEELKAALPNIKDNKRKLLVLMNLGDYYLAIDAYKMAQEAFENALVLENKNKIKGSDYQIFKKLAKLAMHFKETEKAADLYEKVIHIEDSIQQRKKNNIYKISDWKTKYTLNIKEDKIDDLKLTNQIDKEEIKNNKSNLRLLLILVSLLALSSLVFFIRKRKIANAKKKLWLKNQSLEENQAKLRKNNLILEQQNKLITQKLQEIDAHSQEKKYSNSKLNDAQKEQLKTLLITIICDQKSFLNPDLTLDSLAKELKINRSYLSQIINEHFKMNFKQLINYYRVLEACQMFKEKSNLEFTIEYIAIKAGFKSISPFNIAFKKHTGTTPSAYRKNMIKEEAFIK